MHPEIRLFPSLHFYKDALQDGPNTVTSTYTPEYHSDKRFGPYLFIDIPGIEDSAYGQSYRNVKVKKTV